MRFKGWLQTSHFLDGVLLLLFVLEFHYRSTTSTLFIVHNFNDLLNLPFTGSPTVRYKSARSKLVVVCVWASWKASYNYAFGFILILIVISPFDLLKRSSVFYIAEPDHNSWCDEL